jgi:hypothetical protein
MVNSYEIVIDYGASRLFSIMELELSDGMRKHISELYVNEAIELNGSCLDITDKDEFDIAVMAYLTGNIYPDILKTLHKTGPINMRKLSILLNAPYSYVYDSVKDLCMLRFVEIKGGPVRLLGKVIPESAWQEDKLKHKDKIINEIKQSARKAHKAEEKFLDGISEKAKKFRFELNLSQKRED